MSWKHNSTDTEQRKARLAQLVADGRTVAEAGQCLGVSKGQTSRLWQNIKNDLGWQAS